ARLIANSLPCISEMFECCGHLMRRVCLQLLQRHNRDVLIAHFTERVRNVAQGFENRRELSLVQVRREISQRTSQTPRSNAYRVHSFRIAPIKRRSAEVM